jgi:predicted nucleic-acid-binding protein
MYGLDTNVLVRFLLRDDLKQAEQARKAIENALLEGQPVVVSLLTILETEWVLRSCAKLEKVKLISVFRILLEARDLQIEEEEVLEEALFYYESSRADFADCLMSARYARLGCSAMLTFDQVAAKLPRNMLLPLEPG